MNRQAWIAWILILLQAAMFWYMSDGDTVFFPIVVAAISLPAVLWRRRWEIGSGYLPWIDLTVAAGCTLKWNLAPYEPPTMTGFVSYPLVHAAAQFFLLVQVARLWARRPDRPLPMYLPLLAVLVFICLGDVGLSKYGRMRRMYERATLALVGLSCAYYSMTRRKHEPPSHRARWVRPTISTAVLLLCIFTARATNAWVLDRWSAIEQWILHASGSRPNQGRRNLLIGFSGQAPLGSVQLLRSSLSDQIALRVFSDQAPGYLRGAVFERYTPRGWEWHSDWLPLTHTRHPLAKGEQFDISNPAGVPRQSVFVLRPTSSGTLRPVTVWRAPAMDRFTFLPLTTARLEAPTDLLYVDRHGVVAAENFPSEACLTAWVSEQFDAPRLEPIVQPTNWQPGTEMELPRLDTVMAKVRLRQLPERMNPRVIELASKIFAGCSTPREKVTAVQRYFSDYLYAESVEVPTRDPVSHFLLEKLPAHCEFFASGTALLLRLGGIPCRYVTGYAGAEYSAIGRYWIVRQRDAHAWVEAYLPGEGWTIVDSTPSYAVPPTVESFGLWQLWDDLSLRGQIMRTALAREGFAGKILALKLFFLTLLTTVPGGVLTGGLVFLAVRKVRFTRKTRQSQRLDPAVLELQIMLDELDRRLRRLNLERQPHETINQFALRLRDAATTQPKLQHAADWYMHYAAARYGSLPDDRDYEDLRIELRVVCDRLRESRSGK